MKKLHRLFVALTLTLIITSFTSATFDENWYICTNCCKTKKAGQAPWEGGCKKSGGTHNFWFVGKAGDYNYTCRHCDAEVYLTSSQGPAASTCCATGGTHTWYHQ